MNYLKIQFKNGRIEEFKTHFNNPSNDVLCNLAYCLFQEYKHLDSKILDCNDLQKFYTGLSKEKTFNYLGAKILDFRKIDGRTQTAKSLRYYTHQFLFENYV